MTGEPGGLFVDRAAAKEALQLVLPMLESAARNEKIGLSGVIYVVIMDPTRPPGAASFEEAILLEHHVGKERSTWDADYGMYARAKAKLSWRTQRDSSAVQALSPHLLANGELTVWGSVCVDGIVVAISGLEPMYDEALAGSVAYALRAVAKQRAAATK